MLAKNISRIIFSSLTHLDKKNIEKTNFLKFIMFFYTKVLTLFTKGVYLIDQLGPTYNQLQTGVREKEEEETKGESVTKSRR